MPHKVLRVTRRCLPPFLRYVEIFDTSESVSKIRQGGRILPLPPARRGRIRTFKCVWIVDFFAEAGKWVVNTWFRAPKKSRYEKWRDCCRWFGHLWVWKSPVSIWNFVWWKLLGFSTLIIVFCVLEILIVDGFVKFKSIFQILFRNHEPTRITFRYRYQFCRTL